MGIPFIWILKYFKQGDLHRVYKYGDLKEGVIFSVFCDID